jgi:hypothetical protein
MYLSEEVRESIIDRINAVSTTDSVVYRSTVAQYDSYPAYVLEYAENENIWSSTKSDKKTFLFNLYVVYEHDNTEAGRNEAEANISNSIGELYRDVFADPDALNKDVNGDLLPVEDRLQSAWVRASNTSWGYGGTDDVNLRMAMMQLEVIVHQDRL